MSQVQEDEDEAPPLEIQIARPQPSGAYEGWIGIDPGTTGALARVWADGRVEVRDAPIVEVKVKGSTRKKRSVFDAVRMADLVRELLFDDIVSPGRVLVVIEHVQATPNFRPGQGQGMSPRSAFAFGYGAGIWEGVVAAIGVPYVRPFPQSWKPRLGLAKQDKAAAVPRARSLYPQASPLLQGPRGGLRLGPADAICLAHYGRLLSAGR